jgi:hypothetical protein
MCTCGYPQKLWVSEDWSILLGLVSPVLSIVVTSEPFRVDRLTKFSLKSIQYSTPRL